MAKVDYAALVAPIISDGLDVVVWDKDSTLADTLHRQPMLEKIRAGEATWDDYSAACSDDVPMWGAVALMRLLPAIHVVVSGASESARDKIEAWGQANGVPWNYLILRPAGLHVTNPEFKARVMRALMVAGHQVRLCVEDWPAAAEAVEALGVPTLVVNPRYPEGSPHANPTQ